MSKFAKITRILWKIMLFSIVLIVFFLGALYFALQTEKFQTWAAKKAAVYLSKELNAKIEIERLKISFISNVTLQGVFVSDKHLDTLIFGKNITVDVTGFNYEARSLKVDDVELSDVKVKLLKYKNETDFNFKFLADYFSQSDTTQIDTIPSPWKISYGVLNLRNVDFTYRLLSHTNTIGQNMNYNNIHAQNVNGTFTEFDFKGDTIIAQISNLSAKESCGIELKDLTTKLRISATELKCDSIYLKTANSLVKGNLLFKYDEWADYQDFINKVYMKGNLKDSTYINFKDIAYFAPDLNSFNQTLFLSGKVSGFVNNLSGSSMRFKYLNNTEFIGDIGITGLPDIQKSYIHFDADKLSTSVSDLEKFPMPPFDKPTYLKLPIELVKLGVVSYKGKFDGFINDFATYGTFRTNVGFIKTDLRLNSNSKFKKVEYSGSISTANFNLSKIFPQFKLIGPISLSTKINGTGLTSKEMDVKFDVMIQSFSFNNFIYNNVKIDGSFKNKIFSKYIEW